MGGDQKLYSRDIEGLDGSITEVCVLNILSEGFPRFPSLVSQTAPVYFKASFTTELSFFSKRSLFLL